MMPNAKLSIKMLAIDNIGVPMRWHRSIIPPRATPYESIFFFSPATPVRKGTGRTYPVGPPSRCSLFSLAFRRFLKPFCQEGFEFLKVELFHPRGASKLSRLRFFLKVYIVKYSMGASTASTVRFSFVSIQEDNGAEPTVHNRLFSRTRTSTVNDDVCQIFQCCRFCDPVRPRCCMYAMLYVRPWFAWYFSTCLTAVG